MHILRLRVVAQLVERLFPTPEVSGLNPIICAKDEHIQPIKMKEEAVMGPSLKKICFTLKNGIKF